MVISVQCPLCSTSFPVDTDKVPEEGVYARCSVCSGVFFVERPTEAVAGVPTARYAPPASAAPSPPDPWSTPPADPWTTPAAPFESAPERAEPPVAAEPPQDRAEESEPEPLAGDLHLATVELSYEPEQAVPVADAVEPPSAAAEPEASQPEGQLAEPTFEVAEEREPPRLEAPATASPPAPAGAFTFGRRDPHDKARRLARVLVSDMIMYNPERHTRAMASGSLREDFDEEIRKSWEEYVEQVGEELAKATPYFDDALNEILAQGQRVFP